MASIDFIELKTPNLPDFQRQLDELGEDLKRRIVRAGVNAAAQVFKKAVIENTPVHQGPYGNKKDPKTPGTLKRNIIAVRSRSGSVPGVELFTVTARQGRGGKSGDAFYWRFVEAGHLKRGPKLQGGRHARALQRSRRGSGAGRVPGLFFFRYAFNVAKDQALKAFNDRIQARIDLANHKR